MFDLIILDRTKAGKLLLSQSKRDTVTHILSFSDTPIGHYGSANRARPCSGFHAHPAKKLALVFDDLNTDDHQGYRGPTEIDVKKIIEFAQILKADVQDKKCLLLSHCWAGVSRSTAAALVALYVVHGPGSEANCLDILLKARPQATPNERVLKHADALLGSQLYNEILKRKAEKVYGW